MSDTHFLEHLWFGDDALARVARRALTPLEAVYRSIVGVREALYDAGVLAAQAAALPTLSIGNVTVGGTGKTPVAAWIARGLAQRGARPAVVLRGYGEDEPLVHRTLNPEIPVIVSADRVQGVARAEAAGATVAVLDDAFQHRRIAREADVVLVSADRWTPRVRLLPAGPWREPLGAIRRGTLILVTRKAASEGATDAVNAALAAAAPRVPRSTLHLALAELVDAVSGTQARRPISDVADRDVRLLVGIADPGSLTRQLEASGARVRATAYPDHHHFTDSEIANFVRALPPDGLALCTLKDAVKLAPRWPREAPTLWYVSQHIIVERGVGGVDRILDDLTRARGVVAR
jgi:tetraacyldisaccharide 4'-kinase